MRMFSPDPTDWGDLNYKDRGKRGVSPSRPTITAVNFETETHYTTSTFVSTIVVDPTKTITKARTEVETNFVTEAKIRPTPASSLGVKRTQEASLAPGTRFLSLGSDIYGFVETVLQTSTVFQTDSAGDVTPAKHIATQVLTSLFSSSDVPKYRIKRDASEDNRDERQFQTKLVGDVEVVVKGKFRSSKSRNDASYFICPLLQCGASLKFQIRD